MDFTDKEVAYYATYITGHPEVAPDPQHLAATRAVLGGLAKDDRLIFPTIRVIERGDVEDQMRLRVIGPFSSDAERNAAVTYLRTLPLMDSLAWISASTIPPATADQAITPEVAERVRDAGELMEAFWTHG